MSRTRTDLASLDTMTNAQRLEEIQANVERLYLYTVRSERLPDVGTAERLRERINRAIVLIHNTLVSQIDQTNNNLTECQNEVKRLNTARSEEHTSELQSQSNLVCRLLLEKKKKNSNKEHDDI